MNSYVEIHIQSLADGAGFVAQWYTGGERSGQAFPLCTTSELLFFAYFTEAPIVVSDDATRAMLRDHGHLRDYTAWERDLPQGIRGHRRGVGYRFPPKVRGPASASQRALRGSLALWGDLVEPPRRLLVKRHQHRWCLVG
jgi:hypothetical protein